MNVSDAQTSQEKNLAPSVLAHEPKVTTFGDIAGMIYIEFGNHIARVGGLFHLWADAKVIRAALSLINKRATLTAEISKKRSPAKSATIF